MLNAKSQYNNFPEDYNDLIQVYPLRIIKTESDNDYYLNLYEELSDLYIEFPEKDFIGDYLETLAILIEQFEKKAYIIPETSGIDALKFLIEQHELKQKDLIPIFKTPSIVSEIISGKRSFTIEHIKKLSEKFGVRAEVFI